MQLPTRVLFTAMLFFVGLSLHGKRPEVSAQSKDIQLGNSRAKLSIERTSGIWSLEVGSASIKSAAFRVEVSSANGAQLIGNPVSTDSGQFNDKLGKGQQVRQVWRAGGLRVERELRLYEDGGLAITGRVVNESQSDARLGTAVLLESGAWQLGEATENPAAVLMPKTAQTSVIPASAANQNPEQDYSGTGVMAFHQQNSRASLLVGYLRAADASPDLAAKFKRGAGGVSLAATSRFMNRILAAGKTVELNLVYLAASNDPYRLLETYGDAMAKLAPMVVRTGPTSLWCSWYAHRMEVSEEKVLANAEVAAKHFGPLGFEVMQVDHGWQSGDITGDWTPNERFPHGLKWLSEQLRQRYGLKLGLWISPTDVADTSRFYQQHPDWMLKGEDGKAKVNWKWYWKPFPNCYQLDTTRQEAFDHVAQTFKQLTDEGVSYFKIDFIGSNGKEQFVPFDEQTTRGWSVLRRSMEAVRAGAGDAWVRYCQAPPLLSAGLANGAYGGDDTADAGVPGMFRVLRDNARILATSYWVNDRAYHREVCDMSMRMHADIEEARVRAAIMTLADASISWSDELTYLPPSRIRMMQQCLPAGNPPMRPVDLFDREVPSVWHIPAKNSADSWDVVGLFNFTDKAEPRGVRFDQFGLDSSAEYAVFEFWEEKFLGVVKAGIELQLPPESSRILSIRRVTGSPQLLGTDMHLLQGYHELKQVNWDAKQAILSGRFERMPGLQSKAFFLVPAGYTPKFEFPLSPNSARLTHVSGNVWMQEIQFNERQFDWKIPFEQVKPPATKEPNQ